jgi:hypothetical protein
MAGLDGLLAHLLLRFLKHVSKWGLSFSRCRDGQSAVWMKIDLLGTPADAMGQQAARSGP